MSDSPDDRPAPAAHLWREVSVTFSDDPHVEYRCELCPATLTTWPPLNPDPVPVASS